MTEHCSVTTKYNNINIFQETLSLEKTIDQAKVIKESHDILLNLQSILKDKDNKAEIKSLSIKASLFKDKKISPYSFYSYLDELARRHNIIVGTGRDLSLQYMRRFYEYPQS